MNGADDNFDVPREALYEQVIENLAEGVMLIDLDSMAIHAANPAIAMMLGYTVAELTALKVYDIVAHPKEQVRKTADIALNSGRHFLSRRRYRHKDGHVLLVDVSVNHVDIAHRRLAFAIVRDLAETVALEHRLKSLLLFDAMTGLPTSDSLRDHADSALALARHDGRQLVYIVLDLNRFSAVNQRFGLTVGDQVIVHVGHRLSTALKDGDTVARLPGGDEFGILCPIGEGATSAGNVADRIVEVLNSPIVLDDGRRVSVTPSMGAALFPDHGTAFDELAHHASVALQRARTQRQQYVLYDNTHEPFGDFGFDIAIELPRAIDDNALSLVFQPIAESRSPGRCLGAEALVRWNHDTVGVVPPGYFVPEAEEANVVQLLDRWVIENVIRQIAAWQVTFPGIWVSANISARTLNVPGIVEWLATTLDRYGVKPEHLMLEITETAAMMNRDSVISVLADLRKAGIRVALDDFGTGYSSLAYLKHIPLDVVKIDREFVAGIGSDARDEHTIRTIVGLLRGIDCQLLAEGVETEAQCYWLRAMGIDMIQGYWIARPQPAADMSRYLARGPGQATATEPPSLQAE